MSWINFKNYQETAIDELRDKVNSLIGMKLKKIKICTLGNRGKVVVIDTQESQKCTHYTKAHTSTLMNFTPCQNQRTMQNFAQSVVRNLQKHFTKLTNKPMTNIEKEYYKVLDSTYVPNEVKKEMIGGVYECRTNYHSDKTIYLYTEDKSHFFIFNHSDVQKVFDPELKFNGEVIGKGDEVTVCGNTDNYIAYDAFMFGDDWILCVHLINDEEKCRLYNLSHITSHTPLFKEKYIELNGKKYRILGREILAQDVQKILPNNWYMKWVGYKDDPRFEFVNMKDYNKKGFKNEYCVFYDKSLEWHRDNQPETIEFLAKLLGKDE